MKKHFLPFTILLNPDPTEGNGNPPPADPPTPAPTPAPAPAAPPVVPVVPITDPTAPPATRIVVTGERSESELQLQSELEETRRRLAQAETDKKNVEFTNATLADENHRLKNIERPAPAKKVGAGWFEED